MKPADDNEAEMKMLKFVMDLVIGNRSRELYFVDVVAEDLSSIGLLCLAIPRMLCS